MFSSKFYLDAIRGNEGDKAAVCVHKAQGVRGKMNEIFFMYLIRPLCAECILPGKEPGLPSKLPWNSKITVRSSWRGRGMMWLLAEILS